MTDRKEIHTHIEMDRQENRYLVRKLFTQGEAIFGIMAAAQIIAQQARALAKHGIPPEMTAESFAHAEKTSFAVLGKLWVALHPNVQKGLKEQLKEVFNIDMEVQIQEGDDCEAAAPATPPPGETI